MKNALISVVVALSAFAACKSTGDGTGADLEAAKKPVSTSNLPASGQFLDSSHFYCAQRSPAVNSGWIIEDGYLAVMNQQHFLKLSAGKGILNEDGDGTANDGIFIVADRLAENPGEKASSAQWKAAVPFLLPQPKNIPGAKAVLYVEPQGFTVPMPDFKARLKISTAGKEDNFILACNRI